MFGVLLKQTMKKYKITGKKLSITSNLTEGFISDIKNQKSLPKEENLKKILTCMNISSAEKFDLQLAWEKESSPSSFVKRFEELEEDYNILSNFYIINDIKNGLKTKETILQIQRENILLKKEIEFLKLYKNFFDLLHEDDMKYLSNKISFSNKKTNLSKLFIPLKKSFSK
ncbi:MAG: hypothetical protein ACRC9H_13990 [Aeromonas veronii]